MSKSGRNPRSVVSPKPESYGGPHYAVYPTSLIAPLIKATCPERCCPKCGAGWAAVVEKETSFESGSGKAGNRPNGKYKDWEGTGRIGNDLRMGPTVSANVIDHRPTCDCGREDWTSGLVLDPFAGSGTTGLVARQQGKRAVLCDLSYDYLHDQARERLGFVALDEWDAGRGRDGTGESLETLPLFAEVT